MGSGPRKKASSSQNASPTNESQEEKIPATEAETFHDSDAEGSTLEAHTEARGVFPEAVVTEEHHLCQNRDV